MRSFLLKVALGIAISSLFLCSSTKAQDNDNDGCSIATLNGDYAFTVSGQIFLPTGAVVQREGVAMTHFDGAGGLTQVDLVESSPNAPPPSGVSPTDPVTGFHTHESGTYTVHADCTGTFTVNFHDMTIRRMASRSPIRLSWSVSCSATMDAPSILSLPLSYPLEDQLRPTF